MTIIALDSSINKTGYAVWQGRKLLESGVLRTRGNSTAEKLLSLKQELVKVLTGKSIDRAYVETVGKGFSYFSKTSKYSGKSLNQAALHKLSMAVGALLLVLSDWGIVTEEVEATAWKAGRPKALDTNIASRLAGKSITHDEADAILMGYYCMERV